MSSPSNLQQRHRGEGTFSLSGTRSPELDIARSLLNVGSKIETSFDKLFKLLQPSLEMYRTGWFEGYKLAVANTATVQTMEMDHLITEMKDFDTYVRTINIAATTYTDGDYFDVYYGSMPIIKRKYYQSAVAFEFKPPKKISSAGTGSDTKLVFVWTNSATQAKSIAVDVERLLAT